MGATNASNKSDDKGGGSTYSAQLNNVSTNITKARKTGSNAARFVNTKTPDNKLYKYIPPYAKAAIEGLNKITDAPRKNRAFLINNYEKIGKNYKLPDKASFDKMKLSDQQKIYTDMRTNFQQNNLDSLGEKLNRGKDGQSNTPTVIKKNIGGNTIQTTAPTEAEVSQSEAANADGAALKVKKRGRSQSIMTGPKGVTKTSTNYSLGKPSLLGRV